jgi:hypothetical protein
MTEMDTAYEVRPFTRQEADDARKQHFSIASDDYGMADMCAGCLEPWPCDAARALVRSRRRWWRPWR